MIKNLVYLYLLSPLHTGGTSQEGNLLGIARESHTNIPYVPSSTLRGRLRASVVEPIQKVQLFGPELTDLKNKAFTDSYEMQTGKHLTQLEQGDIWIGDASILWMPVPSLSHGVVWVSCPMLLQRWARFNSKTIVIPPEYSTNLGQDKPIYLKDAILKAEDLSAWPNWHDCMPTNAESQGVKRLLVLPDQHCATLIEMSLWRQVKIKLDSSKTVDGGFRYEEAISPDTLMYFPWGITSQANGSAGRSHQDFQSLISEHSLLQVGGQESLGRGFVQSWLPNAAEN
jgi:CRISPR-associated protein Cmr4